MSVQNEITRIQTARNTLRAKAVALGVGLTTDNLTQLATKYDGIVDQGSPHGEVKEGETFTIEPGYYQGGTVSGVKGGGNYSLQQKTVTPTKAQQVVNEDAGFYGLDQVTVDPIPDAYQDVTAVTAAAGDVLATKVFVDKLGVVTTGTMPNRGAVSRTLDVDTTSYTIPDGYHNGSGKVSISLETETVTPTEETQTVVPGSGKVLSQVTVNPIPDKYADATNMSATAGKILSGETAIGWDSTTEKPVTVTGTMPNNGAVAPAGLDCGDSYTIPAGYHNGSGKVVANSLASQTGVDAEKTAVAAGTMLTGSQGWVNGAKVSGTMANNGAVSGSITGLGSVTGDTSFTVPAGYTTGGTVSLTNDIETALSGI